MHCECTWLRFGGDVLGVRPGSVEISNTTDYAERTMHPAESLLSAACTVCLCAKKCSRCIFGLYYVYCKRTSVYSTRSHVLNYAYAGATTHNRRYYYIIQKGFNYIFVKCVCAVIIRVVSVDQMRFAGTIIVISTHRSYHALWFRLDPHTKGHTHTH